MNEDELIQAIIDAGFDTGLDGDVDALTTNEISKSSGKSVPQVRELLKPLMASGYVEVTYVMRETIRTPLTGRLTKVPGYRLTDMGKSELGATIKA